MSFIKHVFLICGLTVEQAFAFVYREVQSSLPSEGAALKRKAGIVYLDYCSRARFLVIGHLISEF